MDTGRREKAGRLDHEALVVRREAEGEKNEDMEKVGRYESVPIADNPAHHLPPTTYNSHHRMWCKTILWLLILLLTPWEHAAFCLTLDEAVLLAIKNLPAFQAEQSRVASQEESYRASLSPYVPTVNASSGRSHEFDSMGHYYSQRSDVTLSYTLYDWGRRKANRSIAGLNLDTQQETLRGTYLELAYEVKSAFYTVIAGDQIVKQRQLELENAMKDHEVAEGRYTEGVAKRSDVLQASVRLEQARFNLTKSEGDLLKALASFNSLTGRPLEQGNDLEGVLSNDVLLPPWEALVPFADKRPEVLRAENIRRIYENDNRLITSEFFPTITVGSSYNWDGLATPTKSVTETGTAGVSATWNVFELGKFHRRKATLWKVRAAQADVEEIKRRIHLDIRTSYEDVSTATKNIVVAANQVREAEHNYAQAYGEYRVGKGDILSLVSAEAALARAREQHINARLDLALSKALLEKIAAVKSLDQPLVEDTY